MLSTWGINSRVITGQVKLHLLEPFRQQYLHKPFRSLLFSISQNAFSIIFCSFQCLKSTARWSPKSLQPTAGFFSAHSGRCARWLLDSARWTILWRLQEDKNLVTVGVVEQKSGECFLFCWMFLRKKIEKSHEISYFVGIFWDSSCSPEKPTNCLFPVDQSLA